MDFRTKIRFLSLSTLLHSGYQKSVSAFQVFLPVLAAREISKPQELSFVTSLSFSDELYLPGAHVVRNVINGGGKLSINQTLSRPALFDSFQITKSTRSRMQCYLKTEIRLSLKMKLSIFVLALFGAVRTERLVFTQMLWRHGLRTPMDTYHNDPYDDTFFGAPDGELTTKGMQQHFIRGQQLRKMYIDDLKLVGRNYSRYETYVRSADAPRCSQSALANLAGFYADSSTHPNGIRNWPSAWTPIPIHTVPHDEDYILEAFDHVCKRFEKLDNDRLLTKPFQDFMASNWKLLYTVNANSGNQESYSFWALELMWQSLSVEKEIGLPLPDWVTDEFYNGLEAVVPMGTDVMFGGAGIGLPFDQEMMKLCTGFFLKEWMDNIDSVINGTSTLKYYAYSGHDVLMNELLIALEVKADLLGWKTSDHASTLICELWEKNGQYFVKMLYSDNIDSPFEPFTRKLAGCDADLCSLNIFKAIIRPLMATDIKICNV